MKVLVVGASGATGKWLVKELLSGGHEVKAIVRSPDRLPTGWREDFGERLEVIVGNVAELSTSELADHLRGCDAAASCLGHNLTFKGLFGHPRRLVLDTIRRLCEAIKANQAENPVKVVLMNTAGNSNRDINEPVSFSQRCVIGLLRLMLPPHVDNEAAADYLRTEIGQDNQAVEWVAVRPDNLLNEDAVTTYELHASPTRSAIFNSGVTSRINVGHFMAKLITDDALWRQWKGQMPVIYNTPAE
ncbi:MAG: SDR family oxidoreductase [bacterium]|nr:SDR family oxidoreductase [bacterium]